MTFDRNHFVERYEAFACRARLSCTLVALPNSNVAVLGSQLDRNFGGNFDGNVSKQDAFACEFGYRLRREGLETMQPLIHFGLVIKLGPIKSMGPSTSMVPGANASAFGILPSVSTSIHCGLTLRAIFSTVARPRCSLVGGGGRHQTGRS